MNKLYRLIRWPNVIMIGFTMIAMRYCILFPILNKLSLTPQLSHLNFAFLVLAMVAITAAGYVINDYFDTRADMINRPSRVLVGKFINRRKVIFMNWVLNTVGIVFGVLVSFAIGKPYYSVIFILSTAVLWFYSSFFKPRTLIGNTFVALLTGSVPVLVWVFDIKAIYPHKGLVDWVMNFNDYRLFYWIFIFAFFAFTVSFIREIIKDSSGVDGDKQLLRKTLPVVAGYKSTKILLSVLSTIVIIFLIYLLPYLQFATDTYKLSLIYVVIFVIAPLIILLYKLIKATKSSDYLKLNLLTKIIMFNGVIFSLFFAYFNNINI